jgi:hypothetical protein
MKGAIRVLFVGAVAGYLAGQVMDQATTWFYGRQSDASKERENELLPEGAPMAAARKLAGLIGAEPTDEQTGQLATALHQCLGQGYGVAAAALTRRGTPPWPGGCGCSSGGRAANPAGRRGRRRRGPRRRGPWPGGGRGVRGRCGAGAGSRGWR